jgi:hypothetical protein
MQRSAAPVVTAAGVVLALAAVVWVVMAVTAATAVGVAAALLATEAEVTAATVPTMAVEVGALKAKRGLEVPWGEWATVPAATVATLPLLRCRFSVARTGILVVVVAVVAYTMIGLTKTTLMALAVPAA